MSAVRRVRESLGLTQRDMAKALGITPQYLCDIEHGGRRLSDDHILSCRNAKVKSALARYRISEYKDAIKRMERNV